MAFQFPTGGPYTYTNVYLDTGVDDPAYEKAFTIGTSRAELIEPWILYKNYIRAQAGNASKDNARLQAQLGYRNQAGCHSKLCIASRDPSSTIIPAWKVTNIPGTTEWTY